ncbi:hypothetical protein KSP40_PGU013993 [Platanthera guangdongensis]|uniref:Uncharacterized protein n=1 Tax=Platanthera guangdongensis TaxID=2320717 RepID=A0ABR2LRK8_9ASPA
MAAETLRSVFGPIVELVKAWNLPEWLVHWGHPGNMVPMNSPSFYIVRGSVAFNIFNPHAVTGLMGLSLLAVQTISPARFEDYSGLRTVHDTLSSPCCTWTAAGTRLLAISSSFRPAQCARNNWDPRPTELNFESESKKKTLTWMEKRLD